MGNSNINNLKEYKKELTNFILIIEKDMNTLDKETNKLYKQTKQELRYINKLIKQEIIKEVF